MADQIKNGISFDKDYWPEGGTSIAVVTADFNDLWAKYEGQLSTLFAEALIEEPPFVSFEMYDAAKVVVYLWEVNGDTLCQRVSLVEILNLYTDGMAGDLTKEEIDPALKALDELQAAIDRLRVRIRNKRLEYGSE